MPYACTCVTSSATFRASVGASTACALAATPLAAEPFLGRSLPLGLLAAALARAVLVTVRRDGEGVFREDGSGRREEREREDADDMALAETASMANEERDGV